MGDGQSLVPQVVVPEQFSVDIGAVRPAENPQFRVYGHCGELCRVVADLVEDWSPQEWEQVTNYCALIIEAKAYTVTAQQFDGGDTDSRVGNQSSIMVAVIGSCDRPWRARYQFRTSSACGQRPSAAAFVASSG
jgi:hypothetical protein